MCVKQVRNLREMRAESVERYTSAKHLSYMRGDDTHGEMQKRGSLSKL